MELNVILVYLDLDQPQFAVLTIVLILLEAALVGALVFDKHWEEVCL